MRAAGLIGEDPPAGDPGSSTQTSATQNCTRCGLPLAKNRPQSGCPRCALRLALGEEEDDQPASVDSATRKDSPQLRYGHFLIMLEADGLPAELGSGAMATTYRALDTTLQMPVALKVISRRAADHPAARARFLREARAAGRVHHPNVASVTFYGEQDGECFYAMELVEGETLAERVCRLGPFSPEQTLEIGVQVARALAAAETCGVVHRDLKPSNLMLVGALTSGAPGSQPTGTPLHVKVIDWGLAKAVSAQDEFLGADHTRDGFVGTPAFASPEQFAGAGREQRIDTRSDIYSLGVTLWYLLCGKTPSVGDTLSAIHAGQKKLPLEQLVAARVPGCLVEAIRHMLSFHSAARPQSARELLDLLQRCQRKHTGQMPRAEWRKRSWQLTTALLTVLVLGTGTATWWWRHPVRIPAVIGGEKPSMAVLPFEKLGADETNVFSVTSVQDGIVNDLAYVTGLDVISAASTREYLPGQSRNLAKIGQELDVRYLLEGSVQRRGEQMEVSVRLSDLHDPEHPWRARYSRRVSEVFAIQSEITRAVTAEIGATLSNQEKAAIDRPPTRDLAAYNLYVRGKDNGQIFQTVEQERRYRLETSIPLLKQAVERDPKFALAYAQLAKNYLRLFTYDLSNGQAEAVADRKEAEAALAHAVRLQPEAGETHLAQAISFYALQANYEQALSELAMARRAMPSNAEVDFFAYAIATNLGRADEAAHFLERTARLEPRNADSGFSLALYYRVQRRFEQSDDEIARVIAATPRNASLSYRGFRAIGRLEERADLTPLRELYASVTPEDAPLPESVTKAHLIIALYSHDAEGATRAAADIPSEGLQWGEFALPKAWFEALAARLRHDDAAAREAFLRARAEEEKSLASEPHNDYFLSVLAMIDAGLGDKDKAFDDARQVSLNTRDQSAILTPLVAYQVAVAYAWMDEPDLACQMLEPWVDRPAAWSLVKVPNYGDFRLNPVWDALQNNPRFIALVARFAPKSR